MIIREYYWEELLKILELPQNKWVNELILGTDDAIGNKILHDAIEEIGIDTKSIKWNLNSLKNYAAAILFTRDYEYAMSLSYVNFYKWVLEKKGEVYLLNYIGYRLDCDIRTGLKKSKIRRQLFDHAIHGDLTAKKIKEKRKQLQFGGRKGSQYYNVLLRLMKLGIIK